MLSKDEIQKQNREASVRLFCLIGELAYIFGQTEDTMKEFSNILIDSRVLFVGEILTCDLPFEKLCAKLMSLYRLRQKNPKRVEEFERVLTRIKRHAKKRNDAIHASWLVIAPPFSKKSEVEFTQSQLRVSFEAGLSGGIKNVDLKSLEAIVTEMKKDAADLFQFRIDWECGEEEENSN